MGIFMHRLHPPFQIVTVSDASPPNKSTNFATEGNLVMLAEDRIDSLRTDSSDILADDQVLLLGGHHHVLAGLSQKATKVSHSTSHAETHAAAKGVPLGQMTALRYTEPELTITHGTITSIDLIELLDTSACPLPHDHFIDCRDLWELSCGLKGIP